MIKKAEKDYCNNNLNTRNVTDNEQFWKTVKPFFMKKVGGNEKINFNGKLPSSFRGQQSA